MEKLHIWQNAMELSLLIYTEFNSCRDFGFVNQITRSSVSIPSNIAEGYGRNGDKEFVRFLRIALGSAYELKTQIILAAKLKYLNDESLTKLTFMVDQLIGMIINLINSKKVN